MLNWLLKTKFYSRVMTFLCYLVLSLSFLWSINCWLYWITRIKGRKICFFLSDLFPREVIKLFVNTACNMLELLFFMYIYILVIHNSENCSKHFKKYCIIEQLLLCIICTLQLQWDTYNKLVENVTMFFYRTELFFIV